MTVAVTEVIERATPRQIPGWAELAAGRSFYVGADWLHYADTDRVSDGRYFAVMDGDRALAATVAHWSPEGLGPDYTAESLLGKGVPGSSVTLGGRRGYLSEVLLDRSLPAQEQRRAVATLLRAAAPSGQWWWPYLPAESAGLLLTGGPEFPDLDWQLVGADCVLELTGGSLDDHIAALPTRQRRTNFRREQRRFAESRLEIRRLKLPDWWQRLGPLLANVQNKYGHSQTNEQMCEVLHRQGEYLAGYAVVFGCFDGEEVVGFSLCYRSGDELALRVVGFDYERVIGADEYAQLSVHAPLAYCYEQGIHRLQLGIDSYGAKLRRGAQIRPLWAVSSLPDRPRRDHAVVVSGLVAELPEHEAEELRTTVENTERNWMRWRGER